MAAYSFLDVQAAIAGPGLVANLASGAAAAEEGITIEPSEEKNVMQIGADGQGQHSLVANEACKVTIRLLKTSPINAILMAAYEFQSSSASFWGRNVMTIVDTSRGDVTTVQQAAFNKKPSLTYAKEAGMNEWVFDAVKVNTLLGIGTTEI